MGAKQERANEQGQAAEEACEEKEEERHQCRCVDDEK